MRIILFLLFVFGFAISIFSQGKGNLYLYYRDSGLDEINLELLYKGDTIYSKKITGDTSLEMKDLEPGMYTAIFKSVHNSTDVIYRGFEIKAGYETDLNFSGRWYIDYNLIEAGPDTLTRKEGQEHMFFDLNYFYGNQLNLDPGNPVKNEYGFGITEGFNFAYTKWFSLVIRTGFMYSHAYFSPDSSLFTLKKRTLERYTYGTIPMTLGFMLSTKNQRSYKFSKGFVLEGGIRYNVPVLARHVVRYRDVKTIHQNIHQWNDVRLYAGLGYFPFLGFVEYALNDFFMGTYPEMPKVRFGLKVMIGN